MSKASTSGKGGKVLGSADDWMALAVARSRSMRLPSAAMASRRAATVRLISSESDENSELCRTSTLASRSPDVISSSVPLTCQMLLTTTWRMRMKMAANSAANTSTSMNEMTRTARSRVWTASATGRRAMARRPSTSCW